MCKPTNIETRRVVIAGAGPAGLLLSGLLLERNKDQSRNVKYDVTLIESRNDLGKLNPETDLQAYRSWMIGLAGHGLEAVRSLPGLYEDYVAQVGVAINEFHIYFGSKKMSFSTEDPTLGNIENFIVDRNFIVAALARHMHEKHSGNNLYSAKYETEVLYVDHVNHRILIRDKSSQEEQYLPYDLLVGADGIRSTVRESLVKRHFDFELEVTDIFNTFKAVHVKRPESISPTSMSVFPNCLPDINGICLPEKGDVVNISLGASRNNFDNIASELKSDDAKVVAKYLKENLKAVTLTDEGYLDFAEQWVDQRWNRTGMVHCNMYHSLPCKIILMGDAAHATSPSIGMGMNTALRDAQKFNEILDKFQDDLDLALPEYSKQRVPEGNSLTDTALHTYCFDTKTQMVSMVKGAIRSKLHQIFPSLFERDYQAYIGNPKWTLSQVYQLGIDQGVISKHREINNRIRQQFFERQTGMVSKKTDSKFNYKLMVAVVAAAIGATTFLK